MPSSEINSYAEACEIVGVEPDATTSEIKAAFRDRLLEVHSDHSDHPRSNERTRRLLKAREFLLTSSGDTTSKTADRSQDTDSTDTSQSSQTHTKQTTSSSSTHHDRTTTQGTHSYTSRDRSQTTRDRTKRTHRNSSSRSHNSQQSYPADPWRDDWMAALGFPWIITPVLIAIGTTIVSVIAPISSVAIPWIGIAGRVGVSLLIGSVVYLTVNQYLGRPDEDQLPNNLRPQRGWRGIFVPLLSSLGVILIGWQLRTTGTIWALIHLDLIAIAGLILLLIKVLVLITVFFGTVLLGICILLVILLVIPVFVGLAADDLKYGVSWMLTLEIGLLLVTGSLTKIVGSIVRIAGHKSQATAKLIPLPTLSSAAVTITTHPLIVIALGFLLGGLLIVSTVGILRLLLFQIPREYTSNVTTRPPSVYILGLYTLIGSFLFGFHTLIPQLLPQLTTTHTYSVLTALVWSAIPGLISLLYLLLRLIARADDILRRISHFVTAWEYRLNTTYQAGWRLLTQLQTSVGNARIQPMRTLQSLPYRIMTKLTQIGRRILTWLVTKYW